MSFPFNTAGLRMRDWLAQARPGAAAYAQSLAALPPDLAGTRCRLAEFLALFPVKGLGPLLQRQVVVGPGGLLTGDGKVPDRGLWLGYKKPGNACGVDYVYERLSQCEEPCLALALASSYDPISGWVRYEAPGTDPALVNASQFAPSFGEALPVRFFQSNPQIVYGVREEASLLRLVRELVYEHGSGKVNPDDIMLFRPCLGFDRRVGEMHSGGTSARTIASDGGYLHFVASSTVAWMNGLLGLTGEDEILVGCSRANLILDGLPANADDLILRLRVEGATPVTMLAGGACVRCAVTTVDPRTGKTRGDKQPTKFLAKERPPRPDLPTSTTLGGNAVFLETDAGATVTGGSECVILEERP